MEASRGRRLDLSQDVTIAKESAFLEGGGEARANSIVSRILPLETFNTWIFRNFNDCVLIVLVFEEKWVIFSQINVSSDNMKTELRGVIAGRGFGSGLDEFCVFWTVGLNVMPATSSKSCAVGGCPTLIRSDLSTFPIPNGNKNAARREKWEEFIVLSGGTVTPSSRICEGHFSLSQFRKSNVTSRYYLNRSAVPDLVRRRDPDVCYATVVLNRDGGGTLIVPPDPSPAPSVINFGNAVSGAVSVPGTSGVPLENAVSGAISNLPVPSSLDRGNPSVLVVRGNAPLSVVRGNAPFSVVRGNAPSSVVGGNVPSAVDQGNSPSSVDGGNVEQSRISILPPQNPILVHGSCGRGQQSANTTPSNEELQVNCETCD